MLFNSYAFIFIYFPIVLFGFFLIGRRSTRAAAGFLALASLFFYGWWSVQALPLLVGSICFNYWAGLRLTRAPGRTDAARKRMLVFSLVVNLGVLATFKYADFFVGNVNEGLSTAGIAPLPLLHVALPIGISFYTFTQIAFLVDCWQDKVHERSFVHYVLFVTYFPHLIAGPVLHHAQMMPQFANPATYRVDFDKVSLGLAIFVFGLAKKLLIGDPMGQYADLMFTGVHNGVQPTMASAWVGVMAYTLQIYFDFSGYSDMAVGLSLCLGVQLPLNFNSPYKSTNIIEFWRRWHISLSTFLRDYLYVPLGGNRKGPARRYLNLFLTMLLGGLWHGAAWTFVIWGALHGFFLMVNHLWNAKVRRNAKPGVVGRVLGWLLTFVCVMIAWVVFRAESMTAATAIYKGMLGMNGMTQSIFSEFGSIPYRKPEFFQTMLVGLIICLALPPTITLQRWVPQAQMLAGRPRLAWIFTAAMAVFTVILLGVCVSKLGSYSPFLYFQF
ncbi:MBOAT family O-acyltransferase [Variovorax saccharolyticus]|uniref:MBOAT family O-acyltransferase n=1 Tax=Variovorax saccharolyticus TaxID=3053516 RepID=UPI0025772688|nr:MULTISPECIES: MBOAT family protein [unclassified Variovorax]MDM0017995.1 MBOAT family protein [Variovorax sp. J22R187]MDM0024966.1 MBOAT family protein [Variovorax sp. J31P216]